MERPDFLPLGITRRKTQPTAKDIDGLDRLAVVIPKTGGTAGLRGLARGAMINRAIDRMRRRKRTEAVLALDNARGTIVSIHRIEADDAFSRLTAARKIVQSWLDPEPRRLGLVVAEDTDPEVRDALIAAAGVATFHLPSYKSDAAARQPGLRLTVFGSDTPVAPRVLAEIRANNLARWLTALPPNILTASTYAGLVRSLAADHGLRFEWLDEKKLEKRGAGAFLAVARGNAERDAGIARLSYRPKGATSSIALVGKGVIFDTGGTNLKPFKSMFDMHMDMQGSAVALATGIALAELGVDFAFDVWLAITPNRISATAYTSQDVVTAANGTTIQVVHTDAEGRMVLADTLVLASAEDPDVVVDYATLTGACIAALTPRYSGVFTNRPRAHQALIEHGAACGERVWPFPLDADYDDALKSDVADVKQCAADGYGDHILAARFLGRFVSDQIPWIHVDLSASQCKGGLGHVPTEITGFGVRFTLALVLERFQGPAALAAAMA